MGDRSPQYGGGASGSQQSISDFKDLRDLPDSPFKARATVLAGILDRVESLRVGDCPDSANSIGCLENLETVLSRLGGRVVNLHVEDYAIPRRFRVRDDR
jgi:hypothetical protein